MPSLRSAPLLPAVPGSFLVDPHEPASVTPILTMQQFQPLQSLLGNSCHHCRIGSVVMSPGHVSGDVQEVSNVFYMFSALYMSGT